jgi:hypothetical protein
MSFLASPDPFTQFHQYTIGIVEILVAILLGILALLSASRLVLAEMCHVAQAWYRFRKMFERRTTSEQIRG